MFAADLQRTRLVHFTAKNGEHEGRSQHLIGADETIEEVDTRYGITYRFVDTYMSFASKSVVLIERLLRRPQHLLRQRLPAKGRGVYLGWSDKLHVDAATGRRRISSTGCWARTSTRTRSRRRSARSRTTSSCRTWAKKKLDYDR